MKTLRYVLGLTLLTATLPGQPATEPPARAEVKAYPTLAPGHHVGEIRAMVFTPDGKRLITGGRDKTIQVWDVETGRRVKLFRPPVGPGRDGEIQGLLMHPDGKTLVVMNEYVARTQVTSNAYLLRLEDGLMRPVATPASTLVQTVAFSRDGKQVVSLAKGQIVRQENLGDLWGDPPVDFTAGSRVEYSKASSPMLVFSPAGDRLLILGRSTSLKTGTQRIQVADARTGQVTSAKFDNTGRPISAAWSPDGKQILVGYGSSLSAVLKAYPVEGGDPIRTFSAEQILARTPPYAVAARYVTHHSATTYFMAVADGGTMRGILFDIATGTGKEVGTCPGDRDLDYGNAVLSPDGKLAAITSAPQGQRIGLLSLSEPEVRYLSGPAELNTVAGWTATGNSVVWKRSGKDGSRTSGLQLRALDYLPQVREPILNVTTKQGGVELAYKAGKEQSGLEIIRGESRALIPGLPRSTVRTLPAEGPANWVAVAAHSGLHLHDTTTAKLIRSFEPVNERATSVASSPDGKYLFATSQLGVMRVYSPEQVKPLLSVYTEAADWVAWTEEGYYAASPNGERLIGWTVNNGLAKEATLLPAEQFRATLYRPDVIKLLLDKGSVAEALKTANAARKEKQQPIPRGVADPDKLLPPNVSLTVDLKAKPLPLVTVTAEQGCVGQPIKSLRLLVDGRPLPGGAARTTYAEGAEKETVKLTWPVELPPGKHRLAVLARSKDDTPNVSASVLIETELPLNKRPVVHHLAVGVSKYANAKLDLQYADKDALALSAAVKASCAGTLYREVKTTTLTNDKAKRVAVLDALDATRKVASSTDLLILSFAGHGVREDGEFYLLTHEADTTDAKTLHKTAISGAALREKLADYPCQVLLMLDACHSGAFAPLAKYRPATDEAARALADVEMRVAVMCAAQGHEEALEAKGNGHFTAAVVRALQRDPKAFFDLDTGELSVYHLQAFVSQEVSKATEYKQNPYLKMPLAHPPVIVTKFPMK